MAVSIIKIPFDKCIVEKERRGAALAPDAIQKALLRELHELEGHRRSNCNYISAITLAGEPSICKLSGRA